jgi:hypothetical protein
MRKELRWKAALGAAVLLLVLSCAGVPPAGDSAAAALAGNAGAAASVYEGYGQDASLLTAMNKAKMSAVQKAVIDLIGVANERAGRDRLEEVLYNSGNPNAYVYTDTFETLRKDKVGQDYVIECRVKVNREAVERTLSAAGLMGGETVAAGPAPAGAADAAPPAAVEPAAAEPAELTPEEKRIIDRYVRTMTYMVYFNEETAEDPFYAKTAVGIANEYLTSNALEAIDMSQVESLKKDQQMVYEEETGQSISIIQWLAQKLNADVYIEIDGRTSGETVSGKYYGQANVTVKGFEASTGRLLGSQPWNSPKTFSTASEEAARINALQTSVYKAMPHVISQAQTYMAKTLQDGIKYELILQNSADTRLMSSFRRKLANEVKDIETVSQTAEETRYSVYLIGSIEDLADMVYDVAETLPGMEGIELILLRGKSLTFDTGM